MALPSTMRAPPRLQCRHRRIAMPSPARPIQLRKNDGRLRKTDGKKTSALQGPAPAAEGWIREIDCSTATYHQQRQHQATKQQNTNTDTSTATQTAATAAARRRQHKQQLSGTSAAGNARWQRGRKGRETGAKLTRK